MILLHWQRAPLLNRINEINHKTKPNKPNRLHSNLRRTWILSPGYVRHPTHLYYKSWLVASCPGKKMTPPGGSGTFPVCHTRSLLSHLYKSCPRHPRPTWSSVLFSTGYKVLAKQAQFKSWSESFSETLSLTHVVVYFRENWEQKHLWNIKNSIQCLEERENSPQLHQKDMLTGLWRYYSDDVT